MSRNPWVACRDAWESFRRIAFHDAEAKIWTVDHASTLRSIPGALESTPLHFFTREGAEQCVDQYGGTVISEGSYRCHSLKTCRALVRRQCEALAITVQQAHPEALPFLWESARQRLEQGQDDYLVRCIVQLAYSCNQPHIAREIGDSMMGLNMPGVVLNECHISLIMEKPRVFGWFLTHNPEWIATLREDIHQRNLVTSWLGSRSIRAVTHWADILRSHDIGCDPTHASFNPPIGTNMHELYHVFDQDLAAQLLLARRWIRNMLVQQQNLVVSTYATGPTLRAEVRAYMMARLGMEGIPHMEREYDSMWTPWAQAVESMDVDDATFYRLAQEHTGAEMAMTIEIPPHL